MTEMTTGMTNVDWSVSNASDDGSEFDVCYKGESQGRVQWSQIGQHNVHNAISAIAAARHTGVPADVAISALADFKGVRRRMEVCGVVSGITIYDDFAHHPTAIRTTLEGLRKHVGSSDKIIALLEPRSNSMRMGIHKQSLPASLSAADEVLIYQPEDMAWDLRPMLQAMHIPAHIEASVETLVSRVKTLARPGDHILVMSNGGFDGIHEKLMAALDGTSNAK